MQYMTIDDVKAKLRPNRKRQPARELPDTVTAEELRRHLEPGTLEQQCADAGLPAPVTEHRFCERRWRFDYAWPDPSIKLAVEIEGGVWTQGRHTRGKGYLEDATKYNRASVLGWTLMRFTPDQVRTGQALNEIAAVLKRRPSDMPEITEILR